MARIRRIKADPEQFEGGLICTDATKAVEWKNGEATTNVIGTRYTLIAERLGYADFYLTLPLTVPPLFPLDPDYVIEPGTRVELVNPKYEAYSGKNGLAISAEADNIRLLTGSGVKPAGAAPVKKAE